VGIQTGAILAEKYQIAERLGAGGMARTFAATCLADQSAVVVKELVFSQLESWKAYDLFLREVRILQSLDHPAIPRFLEMLEITQNNETCLYLVQARVPGESLLQKLQAGWRPGEAEVKSLALNLLDVLQYLHGLAPPVIHRDIKPSNLILDGLRVFLIDFGAVQDLLKPEGGSTVVGTYGYMAPEQFSGRAVPVSDLYGLGATLVHILSGRPPAEMPQRELRLAFEDYVQISGEFKTWLQQMLSPAPENRFQSAAEAREALLDPAALRQRLSRVSQRAALQEQEEILGPFQALPQPSGSKIQILHQADQLVLKIPPGGFTLSVLPILGFATFWLCFVAFWTWGASQASFFFALFSIPFWIAGFFMASLVLRQVLLSTTLELSPHHLLLSHQLLRFSWSETILLGELNGLVRELSYRSNGVPVFVLALEAGARKYKFAQQLSQYEQEWVQSEILQYLEPHLDSRQRKRFVKLLQRQAH